MYGVPSNAGYPPPITQPPQPQQSQPHIPGSYAARSAQAYSDNGNPGTGDSTDSTGNTGTVNPSVDVNVNPNNLMHQNQMNNNNNQQQQQQPYGYGGNGNVTGSGNGNGNGNVSANGNGNGYPNPSNRNVTVPVQAPAPMMSNQMPMNMPHQQPPMPPQQPQPQPQQSIIQPQQQQQQFQNPPQQYPNVPPPMQPPQQPQPQLQQQQQYQQPQQYQQHQHQHQHQHQYGHRQAPAVDHQTTLLNQSIRRMQEATHIMRGAMEANDLSTTLERATAMLGELGDPKHHHHHHRHLQGHTHGYADPSGPQAVMSPKHYYELHMMALDELPNLEEYFLSLCAPPPPGGMEFTPPPVPLPMSIPTMTQYTMTELYEIVQYCPRSVPRLYLQICAGSALIRSGEATVKTVLNDLKEAVKCVQCPVRGLFLRHYLLQAMKDKLPDESENGDMDIGGDDVDVDVNGAVAVEFVADSADAQMPPQLPLQLLDRDGIDGIPMEESKVHNPAVDNLLGDLGVDVNLDTDFGIDGSANATATTVEHNEHSEALENLMGGLGVNVQQNAGGLFDDVPAALPPMPPPAPPASVQVTPPTPVPAPVAAVEEVDDPNSPGTVKDSYQFVLSNFIEMNKLWVRIQHMPGDSKTRETKRKRERERNELRMMVGTNLVRLSELEGVTSAIYGTIILPRILDQIVACHDPLAQAYLMDCIIQVFPDEFHIQTLEVVLSVCPKLREKVNIRTILQSIMNRLANYYEDELLLNDEEDTEGVKMSVMMDSFSMFDECIKSVLDARGVKLTAREAIRLESSLLDFTLKCYPGQMDHIDRCLDVCAATLRGEGNHGIMGNVNVQPTPIPLDDRAVNELEKLLSLPLEELALGLLKLRHYSELLALLPWDNRKNVVAALLKVLDSSGDSISSLNEMNHLFAIITPLLRNNPIARGGVTVTPEEQALVAKVIHIIYNEDTDVHFEMLHSAKRHISESGGSVATLVPLCYSGLKLLNRVRDIEFPAPLPVDEGSVDEQAELIHLGETSEAAAEIGIAKEANVTDETSAEQVQGPEAKEGSGDASSDKSGKDDLSYSDNEKEDDLSYDEDVIPTEIKETKDEVDQLAAELDVLVSVGEEEEPKGEQYPPTEHLTNNSIKDDLFADNPLVPDDAPSESPTALPTFMKQVTCRQICLFIQNIISGLKIQSSEQCFNLSIQAAAAADCCTSVAKARGANIENLSPVAYTFFTEAFLAYEGGISDPKSQVPSISAMVGTLLACKSVDANDYETLITKVTQYAARLAKKSDQCKMVMLCSHLFYYYEENGYRNPQRVLECLQRSLKVADMCMASTPANLQLFVDVLDTYLYHFEKQNPIIVDKYISGLIALVNEHVNSIGANPVIAETKSHFIQIVKSIEEKKNDSVTSIHFGNIVCAMPS